VLEKVSVRTRGQHYLHCAKYSALVECVLSCVCVCACRVQLLKFQKGASWVLAAFTHEVIVNTMRMYDACNLFLLNGPRTHTCTQNTHLVHLQGLILDSGHGLVQIPAWALKFALYFGVGTNVVVLGSIAVGRLFTFRGNMVNGRLRGDHLSCRSLAWWELWVICPKSGVSYPGDAKPEVCPYVCFRVFVRAIRTCTCM